ncbi:MAG: RNA polymerase sigma factor [Gammaproteobacteria bacterium]
MQSIANPRAYLDRTATHLAFNHLKHRKVVASHRQETSTFPERHAPSAEQLASAEERIGRFDEALGEIPQPYRDVFILLRLRGMRYLEKADALNLSERQVERYLLQALMHCRQALEDR